VAEWLSNAALLIVVLGGSWAFTRFWVRFAYLECPGCHALNAQRRSVCRVCDRPLREPVEEGAS